MFAVISSLKSYHVRSIHLHIDGIDFKIEYLRHRPRPVNTENLRLEIVLYYKKA